MSTSSPRAGARGPTATPEPGPTRWRASCRGRTGGAPKGAVVSVVDQAFGQRDRDQLRPGPRAGLGHGVAHVRADGIGRDVQRGADLGGDLAEGNATDDLLLSLGQRG